MSEHSIATNAELARRAWDAVARSDIGALHEVFADDLIWHATGATPWRGLHRGFDAVLDYLARVGEVTDGFDARLDDVLVSADRVLLVFNAQLKIGERALDIDYQCLARIEDGCAVEVWTSPLDPDKVARFWAN
jgi:ketosteroid isomerase-like protein